MNLKNQTQFAELAGVSKMSISKAIKAGRLEYFQATKKIDADSPLSIAYLNDINPQRLRIDSVSNQLPEPSRKAQKKIDEIVIDNADLKIRYEKAKTGKEEQQEKKLKIANAVRESELLEYDLVNEYLMMFLDRQRNYNKREFSVMFDEIWRIAESGEKQKVEVKRGCMQKFDEWYYIVTHGLADEMQGICEEQAKK